MPSHAHIPKIDGVPLRVFWYSEPSFSAGIETVTIDEVPVRIYSPERTIGPYCRTCRSDVRGCGGTRRHPIQSASTEVNHARRISEGPLHVASLLQGHAASSPFATRVK